MGLSIIWWHAQVAQVRQSGRKQNAVLEVLAERVRAACWEEQGVRATLSTRLLRVAGWRCIQLHYAITRLASYLTS